MAIVVITQVKSAIDRPARQKATIQALGIKKLNVPVEHELTPNIAGMIRAVRHLLKVENKLESTKKSFNLHKD
ncbi:MAG: 50S ribosomal protein L30 [Flavobacteriales bacterium]